MGITSGAGNSPILPSSRQRRGQRPISCYFCRSRKLRCSREQPCSNCATRNIQCRLYPAGSGLKALTSASPTVSDGGPEASASHVIDVAPESYPPDVLKRLSQLETLMNDRTVAFREAPMDGCDSTRPTESEAEQSLATHQPDYHSIAQDALSPSPQLPTQVAWLEKVSTGYGLTSAIPIDSIAFRIGPIQHVLTYPTFIDQGTAVSGNSGSHAVRCIWLPPYKQAKALVEKYIRDITYIHHVVVASSLRMAIDQVYSDQAEATSAKHGNVSLLLSVLASVTYFWTAEDDQLDLFPAAAEANQQTPFWVKGALDVLHSAHSTASLSVEALQATIIVSFVLCNLEGVSPRYRNLISTALTMSREQGLHRLDESRAEVPREGPFKEAINAEIGRRVWWYLVATDWLLIRYAGPSEAVYTAHPNHMIVNKPRDIADDDLVNGRSEIDQTSAQPTIMSYFLQRLRLAEICRVSADRSSLQSDDSEPARLSNIIYVDAELKRLITSLPSHFQLHHEGDSGLHPREDSMIKVQRYFINSLIHTQRCKLHLPFLRRGVAEAEYIYSRHACLEAARLIVQTELQLEQELIPFALTRFKHSAAFYGLFMANIVFLQDTCWTADVQQHPPKLYGDEATQAMRILEQARCHSPIAAKFLDGLKHIVQNEGIAALPGAQAADVTASPAPALGSGLDPMSWPNGKEQNPQRQPFSYPGLEAFPTDWDDLFGLLDAQNF